MDPNMGPQDFSFSLPHSYAATPSDPPTAVLLIEDESSWGLDMTAVVFKQLVAQSFLDWGCSSAPLPASQIFCPSCMLS